MPSERVVKYFTVIVKDRSEHDFGKTIAVQASGHSPEDAAGEAECGAATEVWKRRYPDNPDPNKMPEGMTFTQRDNEWIACMESIETVAVIEGLPAVYVEDDIYFPEYMETP